MKSNVYSTRTRAVWSANGHKKTPFLAIENPIDLFYLTGLNLSLGTLLLSAKSAHLFVDGRYLEMAKKKGPFPCSPLGELKDALKNKSFGFDSGFTPFSRWETLKEWGSPVPCKNPTASVRAIKSPEELKCLKESAALLWKGYQYIRKILRTGLTEKEVATSFEIFCLQQGADKMGFDPIIAFGKNSAFPHYRPGNVRLKKGDTVLCDLGVVTSHYHSDMTRTFFFGAPHPQMRLFEEVVQEAHDAALALCRPGVKVGDLDHAATQVIKKAGLEKFLAHSLGHGVGLEIHEFPRLKYKGEDHNTLLQKGMVITIEPGLYAPGIGGYRFEDTIAITAKGYDNWYKVK